MRYFFRVNDSPNHPEYQRPYALYRWEVGDVFLISERWSVEFQGWRHEPRMIAWVGIGGDNDYLETSKLEADAFREQNDGR